MLAIDRKLASSGLSLPTHLAIENMFKGTLQLFDIAKTDRDIVKHTDYEIHLFNIYTLIRNVANSFEDIKDKELLYSKEFFINAVIDEFNILYKLYSTIKCQFVLYLPDYSKAYSMYNAGKPEAKSDHYKIFNIYGKLIYNNPKLFGTFNIVKDIPNGYSKPMLITTHITYDLIHIKNKNMYLLESHTGKLINQYGFNKKYHKIGDRDRSILPFTSKLLYILGDDTLVTPMKINIRTELYNLAVNNKWTARTTDDKVIFDIKKIEILKQLLELINKIV